MAMELTKSQTEEIKRLQSFFPFRIVYGARHPVTKEWIASAVASMRMPNKLAREGWEVFTVTR